MAQGRKPTLGHKRTQLIPPGICTKAHFRPDLMPEKRDPPLHDLRVPT